MVMNNWKAGGGGGGKIMACFRVLAIDQRTCTKISKQIILHTGRWPLPYKNVWYLFNAYRCGMC